MSEEEIKKRVNLLAEIINYEKSGSKVNECPNEESDNKKLREQDIEKRFPIQLKSYYASSEL
jgi:hypothetical protein